MKSLLCSSLLKLQWRSEKFYKPQKPSKDLGIFLSRDNVCSFLLKGKVKTRGRCLPKYAFVKLVTLCKIYCYPKLTAS